MLAALFSGSILNWCYTSYHCSTIDEYSRKRPLVIVILTVELQMIMKLIMTKRSFVLSIAMRLKSLVFFVFQEFLRETETWKKVLQTQTYWSNICFQTSFPTFQWCFRIFFFFTFLVFFLLWKLFCTNKTQELAKKLHVNDEYTGKNILFTAPNF